MHKVNLGVNNMQVNSVQNNRNLNFGHSFRVSVFTKGEDGILKFVNPSEDHKLYKTLNSHIVNWLNEDYYKNLRQVHGIQKKVERVSPQTTKHREMVHDLLKIDDDYSKFNIVRSVYRRNNLSYLATGADVPIMENLKGLKQIGLAKSDSIWTNGDAHSQYVKAICKAVKNNILDYVRHDNVLLRSPRNKEIMLKAIFKPAGKNSAGNMRYELDDYEFHENITKRTLAPVNPAFLRFKQSRGMLDEIRKTVQYHLNKIMGKRVHFSDIDSVLYPKIENLPKKIEKKTTFVRKDPQQLEFKFDE